MKGGKKKIMNKQKFIANRKGQTGGLITGLVFGVASLVIGVIIAFVIVTTLTGSNLLEADSTENRSAFLLVQNFTEGVDNVAGKIPTVLLVAAIVLILGVLAILVGVWQRMRMGGGTTL